MPTTYQDAKHWLERSANDGSLSSEELLSFILCSVDNERIEEYFNLDLEDSEPEVCPICGEETNDTTTIADHGMCLDCLHEREDDPEYNDLESKTVVLDVFELNLYGRLGNKLIIAGRYIQLLPSDIDYDYTQDTAPYAPRDNEVWCDLCNAMHSQADLTLIDSIPETFRRK